MGDRRTARFFLHSVERYLADRQRGKRSERVTASRHRVVPGCAIHTRPVISARSCAASKLISMQTSGDSAIRISWHNSIKNHAYKSMERFSKVMGSKYIIRFCAQSKASESEFGMTLEQVFLVSQTVAALAIVGSLIFVAIELRNSNRESRHRAAEEAHQKYQALQLEVASNADLARVWVSGIHEIVSLDPIDRTRFLLAAHNVFKNWERVHLVYAEGHLPNEIYESADLMAGDLLGYQGFRDAWRTRQKYFNRKFQALVDAKIAALPSKPALPYEITKLDADEPRLAGSS
jgi:hypothetical protein